jgi:hypothetical protein
MISIIPIGTAVSIAVTMASEAVNPLNICVSLSLCAGVGFRKLLCGLKVAHDFVSRKIRRPS